MKAWTLVESRDVLKDEWLHVSASKVITAGGVCLDPFYRIHQRDWVIVLGQTEQGSWVLVRQYRFGADAVFWEFPAGTLEPGEELLQAAQREMLEETGYGEGNWELLGSYFVNPAHCTNSFHVFLAQNLVAVSEPHWDEGEEMEVQVLEGKEFQRLLESGDFCNPHHLCAYFNYLRRVQ